MKSLHLTTVLSLGILAGCFGNAADPTAGGTSPTTQASVGDTGLPCDVQTVLANNCWSCHGTKPASGVPSSLVTYEDLTKTDPASGNGESFAAVAATRMRDAKSPMPPSGAIADADIATLEAWVKGGVTRGSCTDGTDAANVDIYATPTTCTSKTTWTLRDRGSAQMHPGVPCIACHSQDREAPDLVAAGTVYPTAHEPNDCNGKVPTGTIVVLTDARGVEHKATVNAAGNFYFASTIPTPYKAKVVAKNGTVRAMSNAQTDGDCNNCHTVDGKKDAPGRIMAP